MNILHTSYWNNCQMYCVVRIAKIAEFRKYFTTERRVRHDHARTYTRVDIRIKMIFFNLLRAHDV